jgi:hypothetical protein
MSILRRLHANRLSVIFGSGLLCLLSLGLVAGCDSGGNGPAPAAKEDIKAKENAEKEARQKAFGKTGIPGKTQTAKPKS